MVIPENVGHDVAMRTTGPLGTPAVDAALARLEKFVSDGPLHPGRRLPPERDLAVRLGTSRSTLREALRILRALGVVKAAPKRGTCVINAPSIPVNLVLPDLAQFANPEDVMQARIILEPGIAAIVAVRSSPEDWQGLAECIRHGRAAGRGDEFERWDREFHIRLARATRNAPLAHLSVVLQSLRDEAVWGQLKRQDLSRHGRTEEYARDHERILTAIERREPEGAQRRMLEHLIRVRDNLFADVQAPAAAGPLRPAPAPSRVHRGRARQKRNDRYRRHPHREDSP